MCVSVSVSVCACVGCGETKKENRREKMSKKLATRRELLERWRGIEEDEDDDRDHDHDPSQIRRLHQLKEQWFVTSLSLFLSCFIWLMIQLCASSCIKSLNELGLYQF